MGVTAGLFGKRMDDELAVFVAGHDYLLDQLEVLPDCSSFQVVLPGES